MKYNLVEYDRPGECSPGVNWIQGVPKVRSSYYMRHNFGSKLHFCMKFLNDVYCFTEDIYSKSQYPAYPPLFVITLRSRCGMEWDKSCSVASGIFFQACLNRLFRSFMVLGVGSLRTTSSIMLQRCSTGLISGEFGGQHVFSINFGRFFFAPCLGGLGCVCWRPVLDERHVAIGAEQFSLVCCFIHIFTVKYSLHFFL